MLSANVNLRSRSAHIVQIYATSEERKQRNRQAQAAFRERRTEYIKQLETTIQHHEETLQSLQQSHRQAADECLMLRYKNSLLERILLEKGAINRFPHHQSLTANGRHRRSSRTGSQGKSASQTSPAPVHGDSGLTDAESYAQSSTTSETTACCTTITDCKSISLYKPFAQLRELTHSTAKSSISALLALDSKIALFCFARWDDLASFRFTSSASSATNYATRPVSAAA